jgi:hypothetical protein
LPAWEHLVGWYFALFQEILLAFALALLRSVAVFFDEPRANDLLGTAEFLEEATPIELFTFFIHGRALSMRLSKNYLTIYNLG